MVRMFAFAEIIFCDTASILNRDTVHYLIRPPPVKVNPVTIGLIAAHASPKCECLCIENASCDIKMQSWLSFCADRWIIEMEIVMRRLLDRGNVLIALMMISPLTACSDAVVAELSQDERAFTVERAQLFADRQSGNDDAVAMDEHRVKLAVTKLRHDRGVDFDLDGGHGEKEGHSKTP
jgi:hypothetical protein